jgi:hypothetical protein
MIVIFYLVNFWSLRECGFATSLILCILSRKRAYLLNFTPRYIFRLYFFQSIHAVILYIAYCILRRFHLLQYSYCKVVLYKLPKERMITSLLSFMRARKHMMCDSDVEFDSVMRSLRYMNFNCCYVWFFGFSFQLRLPQKCTIWFFITNSLLRNSNPMCLHFLE